MEYYVYILQSQKDHKFYVGMTHNMQLRLERHNQGREPSTRARIPFELIYSEKMPDRRTARVREKYWKSGSGREKIKIMVAGRPAYGQVANMGQADLPAGRRARRT